MANSPQAIKRARQNQKHAAANASKRSAVRTEIKKTVKLIAAEETQKATEAYQKTARLLDKLLSHHAGNKNKAARLKSRLHKKLKNLTATS